MELWQFLSVFLIIPLLVFVSGLLMRKGGPKKINWWMGYRTSMSSKNKETWVFAHIYCGKLMVVLGAVLILLSTVAAIFTERSTFTIGIMVGAQMVAVVIPIIPTEIALRKAFDKNGERRR